jgi:hypothetical protein
MSEAENIALYRRLIEDGVSTGNLDVLDDVLAHDIALPTIAPVVEPTVAGLKQMSEALRAGIPDARAEIDELIANGDWVAARIRWTGTNTGEFMGLAPTGRSFSITELEIVRCEGDRVVELRQVFDVANLMGQLSS